ncbi:putative metallo-dependent phosphatase [Erysiphe necator]|uniref:Putative metallo-dependent phosphatase n=1 Tax=Uncinula necator TaxID=52586 RepID=A0A0B1NVR5_UNCNE|nr:putative metallo-dependent phosphatase [Erysiphe necator]
MNAPYWGVLPPTKVKSDVTTFEDRKKFVVHDREIVHTSGSSCLRNKHDRISVQSENSEAPSFSSISVTPSELVGEGLAPRPPSFPYGAIGYDRNFIEKRCQRRKRGHDCVPGEILSPTITNFSERPSNTSNSHQEKNNRSIVYQDKVQFSTILEKNVTNGPVGHNILRLEESELNFHIERKDKSYSKSISSSTGTQSKLSNHLQREKFRIDTAIPIDGDEMRQIEFAPDRSPLQRLEMALGSMNKKEKFPRSDKNEIHIKRIDNLQYTENLACEHENQHDEGLKSDLIRENCSDIRELVKNGLLDEQNCSEVSNSFGLLVNHINNNPEYNQILNETFPKTFSDLDVGKSRLKKESLPPRSTALASSSSPLIIKSPIISRVESEVLNQSMNDSSYRNLNLNIKSPETDNLSPSLSQKDGFHNKQLSPKDKDDPVLSPLSATQPPSSDRKISPNINIKPKRMGTLNKLSKLASDKLSPKVIKDRFKSPPETEKEVSPFESNFIKNASPQEIGNSKSPTRPSIEHLEHHLFDKRVREYKKLPKQEVYTSSRRLDEWKNGGVAQLSGTYLDLENENHYPRAEKDKTWWDSEKSGRRIYSNPPRRAEAYDGEYDNTAGPTRFKPPLFLNCGPLLRYCGLRREVPRYRNSSVHHEREIWRGTVMIVCKDSHSSYELAPTLRLFCQPIDLLPPPPTRIDGSELALEYIDPIAGLPRIGRDGRTLYLRPIEQIDVEKDLSREESAIGIYEMNRTKTNEIADVKQNSLIPKYDGEKAGKYKEVRGFRLHSEQGMTFWRFNLEIELREKQQRIAYRINRGPASGFWVPPRGHAMNIIHHGSNSFSRGVNTDQFCGPDPMWRDIMNTHQTQPFHVMIGGGNQICNDDVTFISPLFKAWLEMHGPLKEQYPFSSEIQQELEAFYLNRYCMWFSQGLFGLAVSQIPMVNIFADNDILNGFGSHCDQYMSSPVMSGLGAVAFKYYMLFQHQSSIDEGEDNESSWILGVRPGPYIKELSRSIFTRLGRTVAFLGLDCYTERTSEEVLSLETSQKIFARLMREVVRGDTRHLLVVMAIPQSNLPLAFEKKNSKIFQPVKSLGRKASFNKRSLNGGEQVQDELDQKRITRNMRDERIRLIQALQSLAFAKSIRITILGSDVKLGAVGLLYSNRKLGIPKDRDFRYMPTVNSSAIVDAPVSDQVTDLIEKKSKVRHLDTETNEDIIPIFPHDVDGLHRNNQRLLNRRNWCSIRQYCFTPDVSHKSLENLTTLAPQRSRSLIRHLSGSGNSRKSPKFISSPFENRSKLDASRPPLSNPKFFNDGNGKEIPGLISLSRHSSLSLGKRSIRGRTLSLTRRDFNPIELFRRSSRRRSFSGELNRQRSFLEENITIEAKISNTCRGLENKDLDETPTRSKPIDKVQEKSKVVEDNYSPVILKEMNGYEKSRNTSFESSKISEKSTRKDRFPLEINLEGSLDICMNMEINSRDPTGATMPYRLIVPALFCNEAVYFPDI